MIQVEKRNGKIVDFNIEKIQNSIQKAMIENGFELENINELVENIETEIENEDKEILTVDEIQEIVVGELYSFDRKLGSIYNNYRNKKDAIRDTEEIEYKLLSKEFLSKYKHLPNPFPTDMSSFVYYRTYSRYLPKLKRREYWWETCARVVDYNCSLAPTTREEAEDLFDNLFNLRQFTSGRTLWVGGTEVSKKYPMGNYNCAYTILDDIDNLSDVFYLLLIGAGVGIRILPTDIDKLPKFRNDIEVIDKYYDAKPKNERKELTEYTVVGDILTITIGDSKEGWVQALNLFLKIHYDSFYNSINTILINYDNIRPAGEKLKTFGGYASGHQTMRKMFDKITNIIAKCDNKVDNNHIKLRTIDCLDISNIIGENVVSGGVRRTAEIILFDKDDQDILKAKSNLYTFKDGNWVVNDSIIHRSMSNNSILYTEKPTREQLHWQIEQMRYNGEPAFVNLEAVQKREKSRVGVNPCFTGDMKLLTDNGYRRLDELSNIENINIININGEVINGKVWCNGEKETIKLVLSNKKEITCTPNHIFLTIDNEETEAKDLKNKKIMPYTGSHKLFNEDCIKFGFIQDDGSTDRTFPTSYDNWNILQKASFLQGCYSANGSVVKKHRVSYKTTSKEFAKKLISTLKNDFQISANMTNTYTYKESYNININRYEDIQKFYNEINFYQSYKKIDLRNLLLYRTPYIREIKNNDIQTVYDFNEPKTHWGIIEGYIAHNCGEILLDNKGMCNLTEVVVPKFIENGILNKEKLFKAQRLSARVGYRMTCVDFEIHDWDIVNKRDKLTGCSLGGWQDAMNILEYTREQEAELLRELRDITHKAVDEIAEELKMNKSLLATSIKPSGTISLLPNVSAGIHYSHSQYYIRRVRINANDPLAMAMKEMGYNWKPEVGQDKDTCNTIVLEFPMQSPNGKNKYNVTAIEQLENYKLFMENYVDHNVSITVTVRDDEWQQVEDWVYNNWDGIVAISFLPLTDAMYQLMPYEEITEDKYYEMLNNTPKFNPNIISKFEQGDDFDVEGSDCSSGVCSFK